MAENLQDYSHLSNKDRMIQGYPFNPQTEELVQDRLRARRIIQEFNNLPINDSELEIRRSLLKSLLHPNSTLKFKIKPDFHVDFGYNITFGDNAYVNFGGCIVDVCPVTIGKNFMAGPNVQINTAMRPLGAVDRRQLEGSYGKAITIGDDVWIGGMSVICPGVKIGNGIVVGAGSVVTTDVPDYVVVGGNPAKIIRHVDKPIENTDTENK